MSANSFGDCFRVTTFGESHGPALGVVVDGVMPGVPVDLDALRAEVARRRPGQSAVSTGRREADEVEVLSGIFEGRTTGAPIALLVRNRDQRSADYEALKDVFRPGHADWTWLAKFGVRDWRGGGRTSGRETVARVAAGAIAKQVLAARGARVTGHVVRIGDVEAARFDPAEIERNAVRCADPEAAARMEAAVLDAKAAGDSLGGVVEVVAEGVPAGWGDPVFGKLDALLGAALLSIGAVKAVEFGAGFALAGMRGSASNDALVAGGFETNRMGGLLGGISTGQPIVARVAVKPTSSIALPQRTVNAAGEGVTISVPGRHDPCIAPRLVPVAEAMVAIVLCDAALRQSAIAGAAADPGAWEAEIAYRDAELLRAVAARAEVARAAGARPSGEAAERIAAARREAAERLGVDATVADAVFGALEEKR